MRTLAAWMIGIWAMGSAVTWIGKLVAMHFGLAQ